MATTRREPGLRRLRAAGLIMGTLLVGTAGAAGPALVTMGDSIGEGVQGADAAWQTQVFSYTNWLSGIMQGGLTLPLIQTSPVGVVGDTSARARLQPDLVATNIAVSGATLDSMLHAAADSNIDTELDLVMSPRRQSQMSYVEAVAPDMVVCWIGNNDALAAALAFGNMDASQLTPLADFAADYAELVERFGSLMAANGTRVVLANVPDVTAIGLLVDAATASAVAGFPVALPAGSYTSIIGAFLMRILGNDDLVSDPNFVLDAEEIAVIRARIAGFNKVIASEAARFAIPVVDMNTVFNDRLANPPTFYGIPVSNRFLGGLFSLDGVHPSNIGHALVANEFIKVINTSYGTKYPELGQDLLNIVFLTDPSIDKDRDGKVTGRPGVGLLETLALLVGLTGDPNDLSPD